MGRINYIFNCSHLKACPLIYMNYLSSFREQKQRQAAPGCSWTHLPQDEDE